MRYMTFEEFKKKFPPSKEQIEEVTFNILRNNYCDLHELTSDQVKGRIASSIEFLLKQDYEVMRTILKEKKE